MRLVRDPGRILGLSPQQVQIARLIREEDLGNEAIALRLGVAKGSIGKQMKRMYKKLRASGADGHEVRSRAALVDLVWVEFGSCAARHGSMIPDLAACVYCRVINLLPGIP